MSQAFLAMGGMYSVEMPEKTVFDRKHKGILNNFLIIA